MLVLIRKNREKIKVGSDIIISIEGIATGRVRIGIEAPTKLDIRRSDPCIVCHRPCFDYYLNYPDLPFCGDPRCAEKLKQDKSLFD